MKVKLPPTFLRRIDLYGKLMKSSRSAILTRFFERPATLHAQPTGIDENPFRGVETLSYPPTCVSDKNLES